MIQSVKFKPKEFLQVLSQKIVILDRDGIINYDSPNYIKSPEEWIPIPGSLEAIAALTEAGFRIAVATNQSGVARGLYSLQTLDAIHQKMLKMIGECGGEIEKIVYCPHHPEQKCFCRKPKPGMLLEISEYFDEPLDNIPYIGDRLTDVQAARTVGAIPILIDSPMTQKDSNNEDSIKEDKRFNNLKEAVDWILSA